MSQSVTRPRWGRPLSTLRSNRKDAGVADITTTHSFCNRRGVDTIFSRFPVPEHLWDTVGNAASGTPSGCATHHAKPRMIGSPPIRLYFCSYRRHSPLATCCMAAKSSWAVMLADSGAACHLRTTIPHNERAGNQQTTMSPDVSPAGSMPGTHRLPSDTGPAGRGGTGDTAQDEPRGRRVDDLAAWWSALRWAAIFSLLAW